MMKKYKWITLGTVMSGVAITSTALSTTLITKKNQNNKTISLFNRTFSNRESLIQYALQTASEATDENGGVYWTLNDGNQRMFRSNYELREYVSKNISRLNTRSSKQKEELKVDGDSSILSSQLNEVLADRSSNAKRYFRGINDTIYETKLEAINSYFQYHKVYTYNGITFRTLNDLKFYLYQNYEKLNFSTTNSSRSILSPNGVSSDYFDYRKALDRKRARAFIENGAANSFIKISNMVGGVSYLSVEDILRGKHQLSELDFDLNKANIVKVDANNGNNLWITDSENGDSANFYGNYFTKSKTDEIKQLSKTHKTKQSSEDIGWEKTNKQLPTLTKKAKNANIVASLFKILNRLSAISDDTLKTEDEKLKASQVKNMFGVPKYKRLIQKITKNNENLRMIFNQLQVIANTLSKGKRYNPVYELPLLYQAGISKIISHKFNNKVLNGLRGFFEIVVNDYQLSLESLFPSNILIDRDGHKIDLKELFGINRTGFNISGTPEASMYKIAESQIFINSVKSYLLATTNKIQTDGVIPFYKSSNDHLNPYSKRLWSVIQTSINEYDKSKEKDSIDLLNSKLNRKLSATQAKRIFQIIQSNTLLAKNFNYVYKKINENKINKIESHASGGILDMDLIKSELSESNAEYVRKLSKKYKIIFGKEMSKKISVKDFKNFFKKLDTKVEAISQINNKSSLNISGIDNLPTQRTKSNSKEQRRKKIGRKISLSVQAAQMGVGTVVDIYKTAQMFTSKDIFDGIKGLSTLVGNAATIFAAFPMAGPALEAVSFLLDVLAEIVGKTTHQNFTFKTTEDNSKPFYWDGGESTERFWGMWTEVNTDIKDAKILEPQKIVEGSNETYWFYNGSKYTDPRKLKSQVLLDFAKGDNDAIKLGSNNSSVERVFTLDHKDNISTSAASVKELAEILIPEPTSSKNFDDSKIRKYFSGVKYGLIGGTDLFLDPKKSPSLNKVILKKQNIIGFIKKIKPTMVVQLLKTKFNIPIDQLSNERQRNYILPGDKYFINGMVKKRNPIYDDIRYITINLNSLNKDGEKSFKKLQDSIKMGIGNISELKENIYLFSKKEAIVKLNTLFLRSVDVNSIYSLNNNFMRENNFSNLREVTNYSLFKAKGIGGETKYFKSYLQAYKWLISEKQFNNKIHVLKGENKQILFNKLIFKNVTELILYLDKLLKKEGEKHE